MDRQRKKVKNRFKLPVATLTNTQSLPIRKRGYNVESYGTGSCVKLPGPTIDKPNVYDFSVTYDEQRQDLKVATNRIRKYWCLIG